jgi:hypothetical protein
MKTLDKAVIYIKMSAKAILYKPSSQTLFGVIKFFPAWWAHLKPGKNPVSDKMPWLSFGAIKFISKIATPEMSVFEYGSGGSTLFWSSKVKQVISIEHERGWHDRMQEELKKNNIKNVEYILAEAEPDECFTNKNFASPDHYISSDPLFKEKKFESYAKQIDRFPNQFFDIVIVDGRARPSCILHAINKIKVNGFLIVDNSERDHYSPSFASLRNWKKLDFMGAVPYDYHFSQTSIYQKIG